MIVGSLLLILVAVGLLVAGVLSSSNVLIIASIVATVIAAIVLILGVRQSAGADDEDYDVASTTQTRCILGGVSGPGPSRDTRPERRRVRRRPPGATRPAAEPPAPAPRSPGRGGTIPTNRQRVAQPSGPDGGDARWVSATPSGTRVDAGTGCATPGVGRGRVDGMAVRRPRSTPGRRHAMSRRRAAGRAVGRDRPPPPTPPGSPCWPARFS